MCQAPGVPAEGLVPGEICPGRRAGTTSATVPSRCPPFPHYHPAHLASARGFGASSSQLLPPPPLVLTLIAPIGCLTLSALFALHHLRPYLLVLSHPRSEAWAASRSLSPPPSLSSIACRRGPFSLLYCFLSSHICSSLRLPV